MTSMTTDFLPPSPASGPESEVFDSPPRLVVQTAEQSHEYKKESGSSDGAMTYDTIKR